MECTSVPSGIEYVRIMSDREQVTKKAPEGMRTRLVIGSVSWELENSVRSILLIIVLAQNCTKSELREHVRRE